jgi:hypothetical protein
MLDLRKARRADVQYAVAFSGDRLAGSGVVYNLSTGGCAIRSERSPQKGAYLALQIELSGQTTPLVVDMAVVEWAHQSEFGLRFISMQDAETSRLRNTLGVLERMTGAAGAGAS